ncbi:MAG: phosphate regulon sensor histidine kinase PhoR [Rhodanobacter sp.]
MTTGAPRGRSFAMQVAGFLALLALAAAVGSVWDLAWPALALVASAQVLALLALSHRSGRGAQAQPTRRPGLQRALRDVRSAVRQLPDGVVLLDQGGRVRWSNPAAEQLLGLGAHADERPLSERLAGTDFGAWLRTGATQVAIDVSAPADPSRQVSATLMAFGSGLRLLLARDISAVTRLEQVRRDFVANVSHELRTPLTVIHGYLELLDPDDVPELAPVLKEMRVQSQRMTQIVGDLLTLSRLETQDNAPDEHVAMAPLLATLQREAQAVSHGHHDIALQCITDADLRGSTKDLHSAFSNLVSNAVRYTPSGGSIVIGWATTPAGGAVFWVRDSGLGIPAQHLARLTERFYRVSSSRSRESGGTGLGLSIVKHVLNAHQARLLIESEPGRGSTFSCVFDAGRVLAPDDDD